MCTTCGCNPLAPASVLKRSPSFAQHSHSHLEPESRQEPEPDKSRLIEVERHLLAHNDQHAQRNRSRLAEHGIAAFNFVSSPGAGKTELLVKTIAELNGAHRIAVIEGDQQTDNDAQRIRATGVKAVQINTGKGCHLDAQAVGQALDKLELDPLAFLFVENVGNLVCPAAFDLGERCKIVVLSVTEGEDKPLKYPDMFRAARLMLINKVDLLPYLECDLERMFEYARRINPGIEILLVSARTGHGMKSWCQWLERQLVKPHAPVSVG